MEPRSQWNNAASVRLEPSHVCFQRLCIYTQTGLLLIYANLVALIQEDYVDGDDLGILDCKHEFHMSCIEKWLLLKNRCPICNRKAMENVN